MYKIVRRLLPPLALAVAVGAVGLDQAAGQDKKEKKAGAPAVVFEVYKDKQDEYRFRLTDNDVMLAVSGKGYKTRAECLKVIDTIKSAAGKAKVEDISKK
jgi:uncharacterized protein YegP (UPF0339 family)